ncbi:SMI1/KNR4 family protein [Pseudomonas putida]
MPIILNNCETPISQEEFDEFTQTIGTTPTREFMEFYLSNNGGTIEETINESNPFLLNSFLSIKYGEATIEDTYEQLTETNDFNPNLVPFAYDDCGNLFVLSTYKDSFGEVHLWLQQENELILVSKTFMGFLQELTNDDH